MKFETKYVIELNYQELSVLLKVLDKFQFYVKPKQHGLNDFECLTVDEIHSELQAEINSEG